MSLARLGHKLQNYKAKARAYMAHTYSVRPNIGLHYWFLHREVQFQTQTLRYNVSEK